MTYVRGHRPGLLAQQAACIFCRGKIGGHWEHGWRAGSSSYTTPGVCEPCARKLSDERTLERHREFMRQNQPPPEPRP